MCIRDRIWLATLISLLLYLSLQTLGAHRLHSKVGGTLNDPESVTTLSVRDLRKFYDRRQEITDKHLRLEERYKGKEAELEDTVFTDQGSRYQTYCRFISAVLAGKTDQHTSLRKLYDESPLLSVTPSTKVTGSKILGHSFLPTRNTDA